MSEKHATVAEKAQVTRELDNFLDNEKPYRGMDLLIARRVAMKLYPEDSWAQSDRVQKISSQVARQRLKGHGIHLTSNTPKEPSDLELRMDELERKVDELEGYIKGGNGAVNLVPRSSQLARAV